MGDEAARPSSQNSRRRFSGTLSGFSVLGGVFGEGGPGGRPAHRHRHSWGLGPQVNAGREACAVISRIPGRRVSDYATATPASNKVMQAAGRSSVPPKTKGTSAFDRRPLCRRRLPPAFPAHWDHCRTLYTVAVTGRAACPFLGPGLALCSSPGFKQEEEGQARPAGLGASRKKSRRNRFPSALLYPSGPAPFQARQLASFNRLTSRSICTSWNNTFR